MNTIKFSDQPFGTEELSFLSNFYLTQLNHRNVKCSSAEQLYHVYRCANPSDTQKILNAHSRKDLLSVCKFIESRPGWDERKTKVMEKILKKKFNKQRLRKKLLETGDAELIFINYWHDTFYGVCTCTTHKRTGQNMLGTLLMKIRSQLEHLDNQFSFLTIAN